MRTLVFIVEGEGDKAAAPVLARRILIQNQMVAHIPPPIRVKRDRFLTQPDQSNRYLLLAKAKAGAEGKIIVLLDADADCPRSMVDRHLTRMRQVVAPVELAFVVANTEFEAWFVAGAESIQGKRGLANQLTAPAEPERINGPKQWLRRHMPSNRTYSETLDQPALAAIFDWSVACTRSRSLDKFRRELH